MPDPIPGSGVILPNKPWITAGNRLVPRRWLVHALAWGSLTVAMTALFLIGFAFGADRAIDPVLTGAAVTGSLVAVVLPGITPQRQSQPVARRVAPYSEQLLLRIWPARDAVRKRPELRAGRP